MSYSFHNYPFHVDPRSIADGGEEIAIQCRFRARMKMLAPEVKLVATPNGGKRTAWAAMQAQREGMAKGFPDLEALWEGGKKAHLEFKARDGSLNPDQIDWLNWLHRNGHPCGVFRSVETAVNFLREQGAPFLVQEEAA